MNDFKSMIKYLRERAGLNQIELAQKLQVGNSTISMWENGNREPEIETLEMIADYFNVDMDFLLGREKKPDIISDAGQNPNRRKLFNLVNGLSDEDSVRAEGYLQSLIDAHKQ